MQSCFPSNNVRDMEKGVRSHLSLTRLHACLDGVGDARWLLFLERSGCPRRDPSESSSSGRRNHRRSESDESQPQTRAMFASSQHLVHAITAPERHDSRLASMALAGAAAAFVVVGSMPSSSQSLPPRGPAAASRRELTQATTALCCSIHSLSHAVATSASAG